MGYVGQRLKVILGVANLVGAINNRFRITNNIIINVVLLSIWVFISASYIYRVFTVKCRSRSAVVGAN